MLALTRGLIRQGHEVFFSVTVDWQNVLEFLGARASRSCTSSCPRRSR
jgi:hypothetical protein